MSNLYKTEIDGKGPGVWVRYARCGSKNIKVEPIDVLENMIHLMQHEINSLNNLVADGTIPTNELDFYVVPIKGRIKLIEEEIYNRGAIALINFVESLVNPSENITNSCKS